MGLHLAAECTPTLSVKLCILSETSLMHHLPGSFHGQELLDVGLCFPPSPGGPGPWAIQRWPRSPCPMMGVTLGHLTPSCPVGTT